MKMYRSISSNSCAITIAITHPLRGNPNYLCYNIGSSSCLHKATVVQCPLPPPWGYSWKSLKIGTSEPVSSARATRSFHSSVCSLIRQRISNPNANTSPKSPSEKEKASRKRGSVETKAKGSSSSSSSSSSSFKGVSKNSPHKDVSKAMAKRSPLSSSTTSSSSQGVTRARRKNTTAMVDQELEDINVESDEYFDEGAEDSGQDTDVDFESDGDDEEFVEFEDGDDDNEDDDFIDDMLEEEGEGDGEIHLGDGGDGGGVNLGQAQWGEKALTIAKEVLEEFGSNFSLYAFKASLRGCVFVRLDKLSDRYGSPTMVEIESFSGIYGKRLEEAGRNGTLPDNLAIEVSSPGAERVVEVPGQLERFKDLPMFVRYVEKTDATSGEVLKDNILALESFEAESDKSIWKLANVRANREQAGKGRVLTRKQKEWRAELPLSSLRLVHLYMDV